jgi:hypothetical protein
MLSSLQLLLRNTCTSNSHLLRLGAPLLLLVYYCWGGQYSIVFGSSASSSPAVRSPVVRMFHHSSSLRPEATTQPSLEKSTTSSHQPPQQPNGRDDSNNTPPHPSSLNENGQGVHEELDFKPPNIVIFMLHDLDFFFAKNDQNLHHHHGSTSSLDLPPSALNDLAEKGIVLNLYSPYSVPSRASFFNGKDSIGDDGDFRYQDQHHHQQVQYFLSLSSYKISPPTAHIGQCMYTTLNIYANLTGDLC